MEEREIDVETALVIFATTCFSIGYALFLAKRQSEAIEGAFFSLDQEVKTILEDVKEQFNTILEPIIHTNSRVMGMMGSLSGDARSIKAMDNAIGKDIMNQMPLELALLEEAFPNLAEKLRADPRLLQEAIPRIRALLGNQEGNPLSGMTSRFKAKYPEE